MRQDVEFASAGLTLRGWLYRPDGADGDRPAVVMSHGFSAVKEQGLDGFAERFAAAGMVVLAFDHRHLGASDGDERGRIVYQEQHDDTRAALGWLSQQPGVDADRIGLWGSSYSGAHAIFLGAFDPRVKVVVAQVPGLDVVGTLIAVAGREGFDGYLPVLVEDHARRNAGEPSAPFPVVAPDGQPSVLATPDSYEWFMASRSKAPNWVNQTTLESVSPSRRVQGGVVHRPRRPEAAARGGRGERQPGADRARSRRVRPGRGAEEAGRARLRSLRRVPRREPPRGRRRSGAGVVHHPPLTPGDPLSTGRIPIDDRSLRSTTPGRMFTGRVCRIPRGIRLPAPTKRRSGGWWRWWMTHPTSSGRGSSDPEAESESFVSVSSDCASG